ncbi:L-asparaginase 1 [Candida viswanathii]|uniref:asparaginase n=1 Tax=Candida viswanathii TaxID=5486 RepID=A0A367YJA9_9ASCO|nr:L-asparaginase 1 [Candida viswanathii]
MQNNTYILKRTESSTSSTTTNELVPLDAAPSTPADQYTTTQVEIESHFSADHPSFRLKYHRSNSIISTTTDPLSLISETPLTPSFPPQTPTAITTPRLPNIKVLGTGGTIASKGSSSHQTAGYEVDLTIEDLIQSIPDLSQTCTLDYEQLFNVDSKEFGTAHLLALHRQITADLSLYDAVVITHGTDTMEETAFFVQSTVDSLKPVVFCGSMRPSTAISSDGPMNLYQAILIACHEASRDRGVLVALNDSIGSGFYITKSNANSLDTFKNIGSGYVGNFVNNEIRYFYPPTKPLGLTHFHIDSAATTSLPEVVVLFAHQGLNNELVRFVIKEMGVQGLVLATMGAGSMSDDTNKYIAELLHDNKEFPVVYSKRSMDGMVPLGALPKVGGGAVKKPLVNAIAGGYLNPQKARLLLQLCLNSKMNLRQIKEVFKTV